MDRYEPYQNVSNRRQRKHRKIDQNDDSIYGFLFWNAFCFVVGIFCYNNIFFTNLQGQTQEFSRIILWAIAGGWVALGTVLKIRCFRNNRNTLINVICGFGTYAVISYIGVYPTPIHIILIVTATAAIISAAFLVIQERKDVFIYGRNAILHLPVLLIIQKVTAIGLTTILIFIGGYRLLGTPPIQADTIQSNSTVSTRTTRRMIEENINTLITLKDGSWANMSLNEKISVLQTIANIEQQYLGIPFHMTVVADTLESSDNYSTCGTYNHHNHTIVISVDYDDYKYRTWNSYQTIPAYRLQQSH